MREALPGVRMMAADAIFERALRRTSRLTVEGGDFAFLAHFHLPR